MYKQISYLTLRSDDIEFMQGDGYSVQVYVHAIDENAN